MDASLPPRRDPNELAFGGAPVEILMKDGSTLVDEMAVANAHPGGARPFGREDYIGKFQTLTDGIDAHGAPRGEPLPGTRCRGSPRNFAAGELHRLNVALPAGTLAESKPGIF